MPIARLLAPVALTMLLTVPLAAGVVPTADAAKPAASCRGKKPTIVTPGGRVQGTTRDDVIVVVGAKGATIRAGRGNDIVCGGAGADRIDGGPGRDLLYGAEGDDRLSAGPGRDRLDGGPGRDQLRYTPKVDRVARVAGDLYNGRRQGTIADLRSGAIRVKPTLVDSVVGHDASTSTVTVARGGRAPTVGQILVVNSSVERAGIIGRVRDTSAMPDGRTAVRVVDAPVSAAFDALSFDASAPITTGPIRFRTTRFRSLPGVEAGCPGAKGATKEKPFSSLTLTPNLRVRASADIHPSQNSGHVNVEIDAEPEFEMAEDLGSCTLEFSPASFPIAGTPAVFEPYIAATLSSSLAVKFTSRAHFYAVAARTSGGWGTKAKNSHRVYKGFRLTGGPSFGSSRDLGVGSAGANASAGIELGGRLKFAKVAELTAGFGPTLSVSTGYDAEHGGGCAQGQLQAQFRVTAELHLKRTFPIIDQTFPLGNPLWESGCEPIEKQPPRPAPGPGQPAPVDPGQPGPGVPGDRSGGHRISAGGVHACARRATGSVVCWGSNDAGQLGDGTTMDRRTPVAVSDLDDAVVIAAGHFHSCARQTTRHVVCWGRNDRGQLGDGTMTQPSTPVEVAGLTDAVQITGGFEHSCALRLTGGVVCWGRNDDGQLGDGTTTGRSSPVAVGGLADAVEIAAGGGHSCARRATGSVVCWGGNISGQLGNGLAGTGISAPGAVTGLMDAVEITAGLRHSCARRKTGAVACWGYNSQGQLGDGTTTDRSTPTPVGGLTDAAEISGGFDHSCASRATSGVVCWGNNSSGKLGDGTQTDRLTPVAVTGLADAVEVTAGHTHSCALLARGSAACWGNNGVGQLGDRNATNQPPFTLVTVSGLSDAG